MEDEEGPKEYRWETGYEKTWEAIKEDDHGGLEASVADIIHKAKRKRQLEKTGNTRLGMMRHLFIILDASEAMGTQDLKPTRLLCSIKLLEDFIDEFFYQNPISQLGLIITRNKRAEKLSELSGNSKKHIKEIQSLGQSTSITGEPSLQNSLELALKSLKNLPSHASREILVIIGSLTTCDPGDITETIQTLKTEGVRCSVIGLAAELHVCKRLATSTGGEHGVVLDDKHFLEQLKAHVDPPPAATRLEAALVKMGFPHHALHTTAADTAMSVCMCHAENTDEAAKLTSAGYLCPQCLSKHCELPVECKSCGLTLVSAPHLARSYHYLFPVEPFKEIPIQETSNHCYGCQRRFSELDKKVYTCDKCSQTFCLDCEIFIHESLHTCPGCATNPESFKKPITSN
ncbi:general transcription factor IIH subunit 2 [Diachasmimorpha longicaudata]|uniref:general transcription factor IIH subunit 2 n=1 Tax=Diachasmimorpha longicaudata TaxID=58733 RepID=UPI0030B8E803